MTSEKLLKGLSNKALIERINKRFSNDQNDDDEVLEMVNRKKAGRLNFKAGFDTYELTEDNF